MCWAIGYMIGPPIGGWALDQTTAIATRFWLVAAVSIVPLLAVLALLNRRLASSPHRSL
jgi:MFS family permease